MQKLKCKPEYDEAAAFWITLANDGVLATIKNVMDLAAQTPSPATIHAKLQADMSVAIWETLLRQVNKAAYDVQQAAWAAAKAPKKPAKSALQQADEWTEAEWAAHQRKLAGKA
jgi:hypothetical protein